MRRSLCAGVVYYVLLLVVLSAPVRAAERPASEHQKIEALIQHVEHLMDAVFIRNNKAYNAKTAAKFLRAKWGATQTEITTAQDFIAHVASVSSTSGQPYRIRFTDGHEMPSGAYLTIVLKQLEQAS